MTLAPHPRSTAADLMRLLAVWLAAIVLVQGIGAAQALGHGPLHRHLVAAPEHHHHHDGAERHHHADDVGMLTLVAADPALDEAAFALVAALMLLALGLGLNVLLAHGHVLRAASSWARRNHVTAPLLKPPRRG